MGTLPMVTLLVSGGAEAQIQIHGARATDLTLERQSEHALPALQRSLSAADPRPGSASSGIGAFRWGTRLLIGRLRRRRAGQRERGGRRGVAEK